MAGVKQDAQSFVSVSDNATTLYLHVDGALQGSAAASVFMTGGDFDCGAGLIESTFDLGSNTSKTISYVIKDQDRLLLMVIQVLTL